jgi:hypothetical protein
MGWKTKESWFDSQEGQEIFLFSIVAKPDVVPSKPPSKYKICALSVG